MKFGARPMDNNMCSPDRRPTTFEGGAEVALQDFNFTEEDLAGTWKSECFLSPTGDGNFYMATFEMTDSTWDLAYVAHANSDCDSPFITITNDAEEAVTIKGRKWVVSQDGGEKIIVEGDGVVGQFPRLEPGADFSYNSYHVVGENALVGPKTGVHKDVAGGTTVFGYPQRPERSWHRESAALGRLPELLRRVRALERRLSDGEEKEEE